MQSDSAQSVAVKDWFAAFDTISINDYDPSNNHMYSKKNIVDGLCMCKNIFSHFF